MACASPKDASLIVGKVIASPRRLIVANLVGYQGAHLLGWRDLLLSARKGEPVFRQVFGVDRFTCLARHADAVEKFDRMG